MHLVRRFLIGLVLLALTICRIEAVDSTEEPFVVDGGTSPDGKLTVVVFGDINWNSPEADKASNREGQAYLYNVAEKKVIGPLEEVAVDGGLWGTTRSNVRASWSPDGQFVVVTFRCGRLMHDFLLYRISSFVRASGRQGFRARVQNLPKLSEGTDGAAVFRNVTTSANPGVGMEEWQAKNQFSVVAYGFRPENFDKPISSLFNDQGQIRIIYAYSQNKWTLKAYEKLPENY